MVTVLRRVPKSVVMSSVYTFLGNNLKGWYLLRKKLKISKWSTLQIDLLENFLNAPTSYIVWIVSNWTCLWALIYLVKSTCTKKELEWSLLNYMKTYIQWHKCSYISNFYLTGVSTLFICYACAYLSYYLSYYLSVFT